MSMPLETSFSENRRIRLVPIQVDLPSEGRDPIAVYARLRERFPGHSYLLESADTNPAGGAGGSPWGRYSYIGFLPFITCRISGEGMEVSESGAGRSTVLSGTPVEGLRAVMAGYETDGQQQGFGPLAAGGMVGYCDYDLIRTWERLPGLGPLDPSVPEGAFMAAGGMVIFDHFEGRVRAVAFAQEGRGASSSASLEEARAVLIDVLDMLQDGSGAEGRSGGLKVGRFVSNVTRDAFMERVGLAQEKIRAGDAIQVVLSQRFSASLEGDPFRLYRALRRINPSPYMFYLECGALQLIGASPEMLVRIQDGQLEVCPIAGTRPRGADAEEDGRLAEELIADPKERAEHVMLVDLGRNDVGRVAAARSVTVPMFMNVERYSHVMHLVSRVEGRLKSGKDCFDAFMSAFPAGTVSGAPKIRAMEIIQELEGAPRGPYAGAVGWFGFGGDADFCITIRTLVSAGGRLFIQAGAGIVADSNPAAEYEETLRKAAALFRAVEEA